MKKAQAKRGKSGEKRHITKGSGIIFLPAKDIKIATCKCCNDRAK